MAEARVIAGGVLPVAVALRVVGEVVKDIRRAALPGLDAAVIVAVEHRLPDFVVVDQNAREGNVAPHPAGLGAVDIDALGERAFDHIARDLDRSGAGHADSRPRAVARRARAGLERPIPVDAHVAQPAAEFRVAPAGAVLDGKNAVVGVAELVVFDTHVVNPLAFQERPDADGEEDVLEEAVRNADALPRTPDPHTTRMHVGAHAPGSGAEIPRRGSEVPHRGREAKGQARDVEVLDLLPVHEVRPLPGLDAGNVRVGVMREPEVQPSAFTFLLEPVFAVRVVQVMRFVLEVVAHVAHDHATGAAAGPTREAQAVLFQVHDFHPRGVGLAHDPAELGPDQRSLEVVFGLVPDVFGINAEVDTC